MHIFLENKAGVHVMGSNIGGEFTLCGLSFDIAETEEGYEDGTLMDTAKKTVTCQGCIEIIMHCRGIRTSHNSSLAT